MSNKYLIWIIVSLMIIPNVFSLIVDDALYCYPMDTDANDVISSNNCAVDGATLESSGCAIGSGCYSFDGNDELVSGSEVNLTGSMNRTILLWMKQASTSSDPRALGYGQDGTGTVIGFGILTSTGNNFLWTFGNGQKDTGHSSTTAWEHWAITINDSHVGFYKNGTFITSEASLPNTQNGYFISKNRSCNCCENQR